jgi:amidase
MDEFAITGSGNSSNGGTTYNPYRFTRSSAGSSSGSGAAIAANFAAIARGSDTGGSIRTPCSFQGLVCIRPTRGLVSVDGVIPFVLSRDAIGPMARTVADAATALGVLAVFDPNNPTLSTPIDEPPVQLDKFYSDYTQFLNPNGLSGAKLGLVTNYVGAGVDPLITKYVQDAVAVMKAQGAEVFDVTFDNTFLTTMSRTYGAATPYEQKIYLEKYLATLDNDIYPENLSELIAALESPIAGDTTTSRILGTLRNSNSLDRTIINANYQSLAVQATPIVRKTLLDTLNIQDLDAFIFPTVNVFARVPTGFSDPTFINYNPVATVRQVEFASSVGFPDITVPIGSDPFGMPVTLSITGKPYEESTLIRIAYSLEQATLARRASALLPPLPGETVAVPESRLPVSLVVVGITLVGLHLRRRPKAISAIAEDC